MIITSCYFFHVEEMHSDRLVGILVVVDAQLTIYTIAKGITMLVTLHQGVIMATTNIFNLIP